MPNARGFKTPNGKAFQPQSVKNLSDRIAAAANAPKAGTELTRRYEAAYPLPNLLAQGSANILLGGSVFATL
jgi:hypothetical protein